MEITFTHQLLVATAFFVGLISSVAGSVSVSVLC